MPAGYPILLNLADRPVLIVGGGAVAARKARSLLDAGATALRAVASDFCADFPDNVAQTIAPYNASHLQGAALAFAATNSPSVNDQVIRDARAANIWATRADTDESEPGDFSTLAHDHRGPITVAVSAAFPALSVAIRDQLLRHWDDRWTTAAELMITLRPRIVRQITDPHLRRQLFRDAASPAAFDRLAEGGTPALLAWLADKHPMAASVLQVQSREPR